MASRWWLLILAVGCDSNLEFRECSTSAQCTSVAGGTCAMAPSGQRWCLYPDPSCPGGPTARRWSSVAEPDLASQCLLTYQVSVDFSGDGDGTVTSTPSGI